MLAAGLALAVPAVAAADTSPTVTSTGVLTPACQLPPGQVKKALADFQAGKSTDKICKDGGNKPFGTYGGPTVPSLAGVSGSVMAASSYTSCGTMFMSEADAHYGWAYFNYGITNYSWYGPIYAVAWNGQWNRYGHIGQWWDGDPYASVFYDWSSASLEATGVGWVSALGSEADVNWAGDLCSGTTTSVNYIHGSSW
jgi:hypothetical protein